MSIRLCTRQILPNEPPCSTNSARADSLSKTGAPKTMFLFTLFSTGSGLQKRPMYNSFFPALFHSLVNGMHQITLDEFFNEPELLLKEIPKHVEDKDLKFIDDLLPWSPRVQKECPSQFKKS